MSGKESNIPAKPAFKRVCDQNVYEALLLADQMIGLADKGDLDREDVGCGILYGILRDSGYKLKKAAEKEKKSHMRKGFWRERAVDPSLQTKHYAIKKEKGGKMAEKLQVYKCEVCGNIVEVVHGGQGELVCCGQAMQLMTENTVDAAKEKHVPAIEKIEGGFKVKVGEVAHPMQEKHFIEWIEIIADGKAYRQFLNPGDAPEAVFMIDAKDVAARELCNIHGLWKA